MNAILAVAMPAFFVMNFIDRGLKGPVFGAVRP